MSKYAHTPNEHQKQMLSKHTFNKTIKKKRPAKKSAVELLREEAETAEETQARLREQFYSRNPHTRVAAT